MDPAKRSAILVLASQGHTIRFIARTVGASRGAVERVVASGAPALSSSTRATSLDSELERVRALNLACRGNLVRVHEELAARGVSVSYATLTRFCRAQGIGTPPRERVGTHTFAPGQEMQHDTSPHVVEMGGVRTPLVCASLVLCFSRKRYVRCYRRFTRFEAKAFLQEAVVALGGASATCMLDNSTVILTGTGSTATPVPEMAAFAERFGFRFVAHRVGDAKRSGRVERPFHFVENNFYPGRTFTDLADLNAQLRVWNDRWCATPNRNLGFVPDELWALERPNLSPLPAWVPDVREVHIRRVDVEGNVQLHTNRYSAPTELIGVTVEVHEMLDRVEVVHRNRLVCTHGKAEDGARERRTLPAHAHRRSQLRPPGPSRAEAELRATGSEALGRICDALRARHGGQALRAVTRLHRLWTELPTGALEAAATRAASFGLYDVDRIERIALRQVRGDFFRIPTGENDG